MFLLHSKNLGGAISKHPFCFIVWRFEGLYADIYFVGISCQQQKLLKGKRGQR